MALSKAQGSFIGLMVALTLELITMMKCTRVLISGGFTPGLMVEYTKDSGKKVRCMEWVHILGQMVVNIKESTSTASKKALALSLGRTVSSILEAGVKASRT